MLDIREIEQTVKHFTELLPNYKDIVEDIKSVIYYFILKNTGYDVDFLDHEKIDLILQDIINYLNCKKEVESNFLIEENQKVEHILSLVIQKFNKTKEEAMNNIVQYIEHENYFRSYSNFEKILLDNEQINSIIYYFLSKNNDDVQLIIDDIFKYINDKIKIESGIFKFSI